MNSRELVWAIGTVGWVYCRRNRALARLTHNSPPDQESVKVELLEDFYCRESGEVIETQRYLFRPAEDEENGT